MPPRNVSMVLDTGSDLSWLLCTNSSTLSSSSYRPIPCNSTTCTSLPLSSCDHLNCHVSLSYADASTSEGTLAQDSFHVGNTTTPITFGCMSDSYSSTAAALTPGLLGMNRGALSFVSQSNITRFAYCIADLDASGILLIGAAASASAPPLNYTPLVHVAIPLPYFDRLAYSVQLEGIRVGKALLPIPKWVLVPDHTGAGQTMLDSGTHFSFLLGPAYEALRAEFVRQTRGVLEVLDDENFVFEGAMDLCFRISAAMEAPPRGVPAVALVFEGAEVEVGGERVLYRVPGERRGEDAVWCLTFGNSDLVPVSAYVIGHHQQHNVWVEYDLQNGRVGFAAVRCDEESKRRGFKAE